ncbi:MAG: hypothetical protein ABSB41_15845 [Anaerolineales bacterium]|jgi:hypothetical protein
MKAGSYPGGDTTPKIASLENRLSGILQPVPPRTEFVRALSSHIQGEDPETFIDRMKGWPVLAVLVAGLVFLTILLAVSVRAIILLSRRSHPLGG